MSKSAEAFRTISEVAEWLGVQTHVLRFWESKFSQVRPVKRAGGRRYYRPADMLLLGGIRRLLHEDGLTIKGVQKVLREEGVAHVSDLSKPLDELTSAQIDGDLAPAQPEVLEAELAKPTPPPVAHADPVEEAETDQPELPLVAHAPAMPEPKDAPPPIVAEAIEPEVATSTDVSVDDALKHTAHAPDTAVDPQLTTNVDAPAEATTDPSEKPKPDIPDVIVAEPVELTPEEREILGEDPTSEEAASAEPSPAPEPAQPAKPQIIDVPDTPALEEISASPTLLSRSRNLRDLAPAARVALPDLRAQLMSLRDRMAGDAASPD